jgi:hypothetical protein
MEPITLILTALAAGAAAISKGALGEAGKDAYKNLKERIQRRFAGKPQQEILLAEHEKEPETWEKPLQKALTESQADQDAEIIQAAQQLLQIIRPQQATVGKYNVQISGDVHGFVQGDQANVTMNFGDKSQE